MISAAEEPLQSVLDSYLQLANALERADNAEQARDILEMALLQFPRSADLNVALGRLYLAEAALSEKDSHKASQAVECLLFAIDNAGDERGVLALAWETLGLAYRLQEHYEDAIKSLRKAEELGCESSMLWISLGDCLSRQKTAQNLLDALHTLDKALKVDAKSVDALRFKARVLREMQQPNEALTYYAEALESSPGNPFVLTGRAECFRILGKTERALEDLNAAVHSRPEFLLARLRRAGVNTSLGRYDEAIADLRWVLDKEPNYPAALATRGLVYQLIGEYARSLADLDNAIEQQAEPLSMVLAYRGETHRLSGAVDKALADFDRAVSLDGKCIPAYAGRADCFVAQDKYDHALKELSRVIELKSDSVEALLKRADLWYRIGANDLSIQDLDSANRSVENHAFGQIIRGRVLFDMRRFEAALECFTQVLQSDAMVMPCLAYSGETLAQLGRYPESLRDFERALSMSSQEMEKLLKRKPRMDWLWYQIALVKRKLELPEEAASTLSKAIEAAEYEKANRPLHYRNAFNLALYYMAACEGERAIHSYEEILSLTAPYWYILMAYRDLNSLSLLFPGLPRMREVIVHVYEHLIKSARTGVRGDGKTSIEV